MTLSNLPVAVLAEELSDLTTQETTVEETTVPSEAPTESPTEEATEAPAVEETEATEETTVENAGTITNDAMAVGNGLPIVGIYSGSTPGWDNLISDNRIVADPNEENVFYYGFNRYINTALNCTYEPIDGTFYMSHPTYVTVEKISDVVYKLTLTDTFFEEMEASGTTSITMQANYSHICHWYSDDGTNETHEQESTYCAFQVEIEDDSRTVTTITYTEGAYLTMGWLQNDGNGFYEGDVGTNTDFGIMPGQEHYQIYYLHYYESEEATEMSVMPVHVQLSGDGDLTLESAESEAASGQTNAEYFYKVSTGTWDQSLDIVYAVDDTTTIGTVTAYTNRYDLCAYTSAEMSNDTCIVNDFVADASEGAENTLYVGLKTGCTPESFTVSYGEGLIALEDTDNTNVKKVSITEEGMDLLRDGYTLYLAVCAVYDGGAEAYANWSIRPDLNTIPHDPYLTFGWLNEEGSGWYENGEHNGETYRVMPGQEVYHIYYLNTWDSEAGAYTAAPVYVQAAEGDLTYELVGAENAAEGQENGEYFYRVTTGTWDQHVEVVTTLEDGTTVGGVLAHTDRNEVAFYTSTDMSNDTCVTMSYLADLAEDADNELYVGLDNDYWLLSDVWVEDWCAQWIWLEDCGLDNVRRVRISDEAMDMLSRGEGLWIGVGFNTTNEAGDDSGTFYANCALNGDLSTVDPWLSLAWLENWGDGWFESDDRSTTGFGFVPGDVYSVVFYLNQWSDEESCLVQTPVHVTGGDHLFVESVTEIAEGQENADYFVSLSTDVWDQTVQVSYTMDDGTLLTMDIWTGRHELGWYTSSVLSNDTWYSSKPVEIDPFEENYIYLGLNNDEFNILGVYFSDESVSDYFELEKVDEKVWKVTLTDAGLNRMMNQYLLGCPVTVDIVNIADESWVEQRWTGIDFSRMELESAAWLNINYEPWELFVKDGQQLWNHQQLTGEQDEWGNNIWEGTLEESLPDGLTYDPEANKLTLDGFNGQCLDVSYGWYDENEGIFHNNLPSDKLTIEVKGDNSLITESGYAMGIGNELNVTFTGDGSLHMKATNDIGNVDDGGYPNHFPTMSMYNSSVTFADSVNVTVEIAGEGLEGCWDYDTYLGSRPAHLVALQTEFSEITLKDNAALTTIVPDGADRNGPVLDEDDEQVIWGHRNPGGYDGISGSYELTVNGGTLNTQGIYLGWGWNEDGTIGSSNYTQTGGTVNIKALAGINQFDEYEWNEETQQDEYVGTIDHYYYGGLEAGPTGVITISGGQLNIDTTPTANELEADTYFKGINPFGATVNISGGEINFTNDGGGRAIAAETMYADDGETIVAAPAVNISGGTVNIHGEEGRIIDAIGTEQEASVSLTGGTINMSWANNYLHGDALIDGANLVLDSVYTELNCVFTMESGKLDLDNMSELKFNGGAVMNGGLIDIYDGLIIVNCGMAQNGGEIVIKNDREGPSWASFIVNTYYVIGGDARLTIEHNMLPNALVVAGTFHQVGGTVDITHYSALEEPQAAVIVPTHTYEDGTVTHGSLLLNNGTFTIRPFEGEHITALQVDAESVLFMGGQDVEGLETPILNITEGDMRLDGVTDLLVNASINLKQGTVNMGSGAALTMDAGAEFNVTVSKEHSDDWDIAFLSGDHSSFTVNEATLTVTTEGYDCAFDMNGEYTQNGGTVTITNVDGDMAMAVKGVGTIAGALNLSGLIGYSQCYEPTMSEESRLIINRGAQMNVEAEYCGIQILSAAEINGGSLNIHVSGMEQDMYDNSGNYLGKRFYANGVYLNGWNYEDSELVINGGTHWINVPQSVEGDYFEADTNGIRALQGKLDIQGCRMFIKGMWPIVSNSNDESDMLTLADGMNVYSLNTGAYLVPVDCTVAFDADGNYTEDLEQASMIRYLRSFTEDNVAANVYTGEGIDSYVLVTPNVAGETLTWKLAGGTLTFGGEGGMYDFSEFNPSQWIILSDFITKVEMDSNVTYVGAYAFNGLENLDTVDFLGAAPEFSENAFAGVKADAYYLYGEVTWTVDLMQDYGGDINWILEYETEEVIGLTTDKETLLPAEKATLTAVVFPNIDPSVKVVWSLGEGDSSYVTLKDNKDGTATVTAKKNKVLREVTVYANTNAEGAEPMAVTLTVLPIVTKVNILDSENTVITGTTQTLYMQTGEANTMYLHAENDPDGSWQEVTWKSSNTKYATVDENGMVTALVPGKTVKITATATDGSKKSATLTIKTVQQMEELTLKDNLMLDDLGNTFIAAGKSLKLATAIDIYPANTTNQKLEWSVSANDYKITINKSTGVLTTKKLPADADVPVVVTVTAKALDGSGMELTFDVSVYPAVTKVTILGEDGNAVSGTQKLYLGADYDGTMHLSAENTPENSLQAWTWKSSNTKYATVDADGVVTGLVPGKTVTITATAADGSGKKATVKVAVEQVMENVTISGSDVVAASKSITLSAAIEPSDTTNKKLNWEIIEGRDLAKISTNGKLTALKKAEGVVTVRVSSRAYPEVYADWNVTVMANAVYKVDIQNEAGKSLSGTLEVIMGTDSDNTLDLYAENTAKDVTLEVSQKVTWKSSNTKYATVDEDGTVTVLVPGKTVTITATAADGSGKKDTIKIKGIQPVEELTEKDGLVHDADGNLIIAAGKSLKMASAVDIYPTDATNKKLVWTVSPNDCKITINKSTGVLTTKALPADAEIPVVVTVTAAAADGYGQEISFQVAVYPATTKTALYYNGSDVTKKTLELEVGGSIAIETVCTPANAAGLYTWKSSNTAYAAVDAAGIVTGIKAGKTITITATPADGSGKTATVKVKVVEASRVDISTLTAEERAEAEAEIRRAVSLLVDRNAISMGQQAASSFVAAGMTDADGSQFYENAGGNSYAGYWNVASSAYAANCKEAMAILSKYYEVDADGMLVDFPTLTYIFNEGSGHRYIAESIQSQLAEYGISLLLEGQEWNDLQTNRGAGSYDIARHGWIADYNDPMCMLDMWTSYSGNNDVQFGQGTHAETAIYDLDLTPWGFDVTVENGTWAETYDVLIGIIKDCGTETVRYELMHLAEDMLMESGCIVPLYYYMDGYLLDSSVDGFGTNPLGMKFFQNTTVNGSSSRISAFLCWEPGTMDPALNSDLAVSSIIQHMFSGLAKCAPDASGNYTRIVADCAEELVEPIVNEDGTATYTYTLKEGLTWSDGVALTAHDFEFAWKRAASTELGADYGYMFEQIQGYPNDLAVTAEDDRTLSVTLKSNISYWNELLAFIAFMPLREDVVADESWATSAETYVTNGAYTMSGWNHDSLITLQKNEDYWDSDNITMKEIRFYLNGDAAQSNWASGAWQVVDAEYETFYTQYSSEFHMASNLGTYFLIVNVNQSLLPEMAE